MDIPQYLTVSNDTYNYLSAGAEPLDEANFEEIYSLEQGGLEPNSGISLLEFLLEGRVKIAITPVPFTYRIDMGKYAVLEFGYSHDKTQVFYRWHNLKSSLCWGLGIAKVEYNIAKKPQFKTHKGSVIPLQSPAIRKLL